MRPRLKIRKCAGCGEDFKPKRGYFRYCSLPCAYENRPKRIKHGHGVSGFITRTYRTWLGMRSRCYDKTQPAYRYYGGRGIKICDRWQDFAAFLSDMGEKPLGRSIDRIDNDGDYEPGNCRWATRSQQAGNTTRTPRYVVNGITLTGRELESRLGLARGVIRQRIKAGWPINRAITTPNSRTG